MLTSTLCFPLQFITLYDFHIYFTLAIIITIIIIIIIERNSQHQIQFPRTIGAWSFSFEIYRISKYLQIELLHTAKFTLHCGLLSEKTVFSLYLFGETCCKLKKGKSILCSRLWSSSFHALLLLVITQVKFLLQNNSLIIVQLTTALLNRG